MLEAVEIDSSNVSQENWENINQMRSRCAEANRLQCFVTSHFSADSPNNAGNNIMALKTLGMSILPSNIMALFSYFLSRASAIISKCLEHF